MQIGVIFRVKETLYCGSSQWKYPFESFDCEFGSEIAGGILAGEYEYSDLSRSFFQMRC